MNWHGIKGEKLLKLYREWLTLEFFIKTTLKGSGFGSNGDQRRSNKRIAKGRFSGPRPRWARPQVSKSSNWGDQDFSGRQPPAFSFEPEGFVPV